MGAGVVGRFCWDVGAGAIPGVAGLVWADVGAVGCDAIRDAGRGSTGAGVSDDVAGVFAGGGVWAGAASAFSFAGGNFGGAGGGTCVCIMGAGVGIGVGCGRDGGIAT